MKVRYQKKKKSLPKLTVGILMGRSRRKVNMVNYDLWWMNFCLLSILLFRQVQDRFHQVHIIFTTSE